ncbi:MAG TPA: LysM peptidoglycan-binding domain-containing protein [Termitinemataceae bacterium]|nr:LysM peptidoglycan-binding domain-containing protein [Termitinemataceae bacterium]HOM23049.1 LysM peptidoglycan-binding domain-containing protein [Termitinemataceae bacterium]HPQ00585.1 LysM peptidoglycan-binding domain-containing protein [Termitinemataceae bacterium]
MAASIGIKIANGEFYPILEEGSISKKRLILTTVHDNQKSVQIDLYKSESRTMADAEYIGSLVIENIEPRPKGEPSIEMIISSQEGDELVAEARDLDAPPGSERHHLSVSLKALNEQETYEFPDFELDQESPSSSGLYARAQRYAEEKQEEETFEPALVTGAGKRFPWLAVLLGILVVLILGLVLVLAIKRGNQPAGTTPITQKVQEEGEGASEAPAAPMVITEPAPTPPPAETAKESGTSESTAPKKEETPPSESQAKSTAPTETVRKRPPAPVSRYRAPTTIPKEGVLYTIRWGDTLWDIAEAFYRNPWLYPRIARFNKIKNPDHIISGTTIRIPPK